MSSIRFLPWVISAFSIAVVPGCETQGPDHPAGNLAIWAISDEPSIVIGASDERGGHVFEEVAGATRLSDGRIVVADSRSQEVAFFDSLGHHLKTIGGEGQGPGEFEGLLRIRKTGGDTLLALSWAPGLTWFSPDGEFIRSKTVNLHQAARVPCRVRGSWELLEDGSLVSVHGDNFLQDGCPPVPESPWRESGLIVRSIRHDGQFDTIGILPASERNFPNYRVYGRDLVLAYGPDRVFAGDTGAEEILVFSFDGDTLGTIATPFESAPVPRAAKRKDRRRFSQPDGSIVIGNRYLFPETYPRFGRLLTDELGFLWVMAYPKLTDAETGLWLSRLPLFLIEEGGARWRVMTSDGEGIADVRTPPKFYPLEIGEDYVLGVSKDEYDVHSIKLFGLNR